MEDAVPLINFLAWESVQMGVADHVYVVGGAVRNHLLSEPIKDVDIVIDAVKGRRDSAWFAERLSQAIPTATNLTTNQYGVAILTVKGTWNLDGQEMQGEVIEIANARTESYGGKAGKGYKPHMVAPATIETDIYRREFTFNTLLWRMSTIARAGVHECPILDLTGEGFKHLSERLIKTPSDPDKTFSDDPTRTLRALKFIVRYGFTLHPETADAIRRNAHKLKDMPWDAVRKILIDQVLLHPNARSVLDLMDLLGLTEVCVQLVSGERGFASAFGSAARNFSVHLMLDLARRGFPMKPLGFLTDAQREALQGQVARGLLTEDAGKEFFALLRRPPVDNMSLIKRFALPPHERGAIARVARDLLLSGVSADDLHGATANRLSVVLSRRGAEG